jgi:Ser/Thr protein kinase RdoA (MazF antagonist)
MTIASPTTPVTHALAAFDALARGASAPGWIRDGIVSRWLPGAASVDVHLVAVSENATFRVSVAGVPTLVVRVHRPGYVGSRASVESELLWIEALLRETGIRTPAPVRGADGCLIQQFSGSVGEPWSAVAFTFVRGEVLEDLPDAASHYREIGALTAVLHDHAMSWEPPTGFERFAWGVEELIGADARWGSWENGVASPTDLRLLRDAQSRALEVLGESERTGEGWGLIHSDLRPSNIMVDDGAMTIIDFDDCGHSWLLYDFGAALSFYEHRDEAARMAAQWLDGYRSIRPLSRADLEQASALSLVRRLTLLGWSTTHRPDALPADLWAEILPGTVEIADRYLRRPLWLTEPV